jgi:hypothetical protein
MEIMELCTEKLDGLGFRQGCCRLLIKLHCVEPAGKKDKSRVSRSVVTESNVTSVLGEENSDASVYSSLGGRRQIQQFANWECCNIMCSHEGMRPSFDRRLRVSASSFKMPGM